MTAYIDSIGYHGCIKGFSQHTFSLDLSNPNFASYIFNGILTGVVAYRISGIFPQQPAFATAVTQRTWVLLCPQLSGTSFYSSSYNGVDIGGSIYQFSVKSVLNGVGNFPQIFYPITPINISRIDLKIVNADGSPALFDAAIQNLDIQIDFLRESF